ncbi:MAG: hypothetical protein WCR71_03500 [Bacteroidales bacterium]
MKTVGIILTIIGIIGILVFGIQAINNTDSFTIFGVDIAVSQADWTPVIISFVVTVVGLAVTFAGKRTTAIN